MLSILTIEFCVMGCEYDLEEQKEELQPRLQSDKRNLNLKEDVIWENTSDFTLSNSLECEGKKEKGAFSPPSPQLTWLIVLITT